MARPKLGDSESKRLQMVITEDELKAIEDWQFENRVPSKSEAIRRLVQVGLRVDREIPKLLNTIVDLGPGPAVREQMSEDVLVHTLKREVVIFSLIKDLANEMAPFMDNADFNEALAEAEKVRAEPGATLAGITRQIQELVKMAEGDDDK